MSSTSSSDCMCGECCNRPGYQMPGFRPRVPFYQTTGHPLIYYAQVPTPKFRQRARDSRKDNPNCFVKAFRWYTQDHYPPQSRELPSDRTDLTGFASWLDRKYDEFMLERHAEQEHFQTQTDSSQHDVKTSDQVAVDQTKKKTLSRRKSASIKRRPHSLQSACSKECGDTPDKCNKSFEYILKPKDLSRPASEGCHQIPSAETQTSKKTITKLRAHSSERTVYEKCGSVPIEVIKLEGYERTATTTRVSNAGVKALEYHKPKSATSVVRVRSLKSAICQCPETQLEIHDESTQCMCEMDDSKAKIQNPLSYDCCPNCATSVLANPAKPSQVLILHVHVDQPKEKSCAIAKSHESHETDSERMLSSCQKVVGKQDSRNAECPMNCAATTSDHLNIQSTRASKQIANPVHEPSLIQCHCPTLSGHPCQPPPIKKSVIDEGIICPPNSIIKCDNDAAQTSDHSICLETDGYPLFMKIVCADKLNEEISRK